MQVLEANVVYYNGFQVFYNGHYGDLSIGFKKIEFNLSEKFCFICKCH